METIIITGVIISTLAMLWAIKMFSEELYYITKWKTLDQKGKTVSVIEIGLTLFMVGLATFMFSRPILLMQPMVRNLWLMGLSIGIAASLCNLFVSGYMSLFSGTWGIDYFLSNMRTLRHHTFLIFSLFGGIYLGIIVRAYNPMFSWIPSIENITGLFMALLLMTWVTGQIVNSISFGPPNQEQMQMQPIRSIGNAIVALKNRIQQKRTL